MIFFAVWLSTQLWAQIPAAEQAALDQHLITRPKSQHAELDREMMELRAFVIWYEGKYKENTNHLVNDTERLKVSAKSWEEFDYEPYSNKTWIPGQKPKITQACCKAYQSKKNALEALMQIEAMRAARTLRTMESMKTTAP